MYESTKKMYNVIINTQFSNMCNIKFYSSVIACIWTPAFDQLTIIRVRLRFSRRINSLYDA